MGKSIQTGLTDLFDHIPVKINGLFRHQNCSGACSQANIHGQISGIAAHNLHHRAALVRLHRVPQLVNAFDGGIGCRIKADAIIGAADVVVNGTRNSYHGNAIFGERLCAAEGSVTANGNNTIQPQEFACTDSLTLSFLCHKLCTSGCVKNGAATVDDVGHTFLIQFYNIAVDQPIPPPANAITLNPAIERRPDHSPHAGIHTWCIAATGQNTDTLDTHIDRPPLYFYT